MNWVYKELFDPDCMNIDADKEKTPEEIYAEWGQHKETLHRYVGFFTQSHTKPDLEEGLKLFDNLFDAHQWRHAKRVLGHLAHYIRGNDAYVERASRIAEVTNAEKKDRVLEAYENFERMMVMMMDNTFGFRFKNQPWEHDETHGRDVEGNTKGRKLKLVKRCKAEIGRQDYIELAIPDAGKDYAQRGRAHPYVIEGRVQLRFGLRSFRFGESDITAHVPRIVGVNYASRMQPHELHFVTEMFERGRRAIREHTEPQFYKSIPQPDSHVLPSELSGQHQQSSQPYSHEKQSTPVSD